MGTGQRKWILKEASNLFLFLIVFPFVSLSSPNLPSTYGRNLTTDDRATGPALNASRKPQHCNTTACLEISKNIASWMNTSVDPCNDFYSFACDGWKASHPIPDSENEITTFTILTKSIEDIVHNILEDKNYPDINDGLRKAQSFYRSCMNVTRIEELGVKPIKEFIASIGSWDMCESERFPAESWNVHTVLTHLQSTYYPAGPFFSIDVTNDHVNSRKHLIKIDQSGISLHKEIYVEQPEIVGHYKTYMEEVVRLLGYRCKEVPERVKEVIDFEIKLAEISFSTEAKQSGTFRRINLNTLVNVVPQFPWKKHINAVFSSISVDEAEVILSTSFVYLYTVTRLMQNTSKRILANYVVWQMLRDKIGFLSSDFRKVRAEFNEKVTGVLDTDPRWRVCTELTNANFGLPIGSVYVAKHFDERTQQGAQLLVKEITEVFKRRIKEHAWIDSKTKQKVFEKANTLVAKIGYPEYALNKTELNERFRNISVSESDFFINNLNIDKWIRKRLFEKLRKPVDRSKWPMFPQTINAMYQFYENEIVIPAGILQPPFFYSKDVPRSLSYGAVGSIIGHEFTHGFDNTGRKFDNKGNIVKEWWSPDSLDEFNSRSLCMERQYSKYNTRPSIKVNGKMTLGENIADNGGLQLAFEAYMEYLKVHRDDVVLEGLPYTNTQLFFIGFAQEYCSNIRSKTEEIGMLTEIHSPPKFRVIGSLANVREFSEAFSCPSGSQMNPVQKCELW